MTAPDIQKGWFELDSLGSLELHRRQSSSTFHFSPAYPVQDFNAAASFRLDYGGRAL
jgi:hypothetical protein